jgi:hypothetical protein
MTRATYTTPSDRIINAGIHAPERTVHETDAALIALAHITQQAQKAARIEAIVREPDK